MIAHFIASFRFNIRVFAAGATSICIRVACRAPRSAPAAHRSAVSCTPRKLRSVKGNQPRGPLADGLRRLHRNYPSAGSTDSYVTLNHFRDLRSRRDIDPRDRGSSERSYLCNFSATRVNGMAFEVRDSFVFTICTACVI